MKTMTLWCAAAIAVAQPAIAQPTGEVRIAIGAESPSMGAHWGYAAKEGVVLRNIHEALVDRDPETNEIVPSLALSWERIEPTIWEFKLREGVTFHDGTPFDADAAAHGINWIYDTANAYTVAGFLPNREYRAEAVDQYTLHIHTGTPDPIYPSRAFGIGITSKAHLESGLDNYENKAVGTGPYLIDSWNRGTSYTLRVNEDWWGFDVEGIAQPDFETATFLIRPDSSSRIAAMRAGEVDFAWDLTPDECRANLGDNCISGPTPETVYVRMDVEHEVMKDPRIREAMSLALDRPTISRVLIGDATPAAAMIIPGVTGYPDIEPMPFDIERAITLVEEARADGVPIDDFPLFISMRSGSFSGNTEVMEAVQGLYSAIGLNVAIRAMEDLEFRSLFDLPPSEKPVATDRGWLALHRHNNAEFDFARTYASNHHCAGQASTGCNPERDAEFETASALTGDERHTAFAEIAARMYSDPEHLMFLPIAHTSIFHGVSDRLDWTPRSDMQLLLKDLKAR
ncbi:MAG: ABC transporter substrate-binding protein [Paracoccus sp. (in: a-proteobacteria)]|uniref:ABC transporter substrate-binding protein n=1 Tax=Paracoccus sp. TaxID=267 RepID=UPI00391B00EB